MECPCCGSKDISKAGFVTFRWKNNGWRPERGSAQVVDTNVVTCNDCFVPFDEYDGTILKSLDFTRAE